MRAEPARFGYFFAVNADVATDVVGGKCDHQGVWKRPGLAAEVADVIYLQADLFHDFAALMKEMPAESSLAFVEACGDRLAKDALLRHYSRERLMSVEARARFVEPDLAPLPSLP